MVSENSWGVVKSWRRLPASEHCGSLRRGSDPKRKPQPRDCSATTGPVIEVGTIAGSRKDQPTASRRHSAQSLPLLAALVNQESRLLKPAHQPNRWRSSNRSSRDVASLRKQRGRVVFEAGQGARVMPPLLNSSPAGLQPVFDGCSDPEGTPMTGTAGPSACGVSSSWACMRRLGRGVRGAWRPTGGCDWRHR